jgi:hypothetical protein
MTTDGDFRILQLAVPADWNGQAAVAPPNYVPEQFYDYAYSGHPGPRQEKGEHRGRGHRAIRVFTTEEHVSAFRTLDGLYPDDKGTPSAFMPVLEFTVSFVPALYLGWHHEVVNNFGVILEGEFEIEVPGGVKESFYAGDLILAEDRDGQGHIDRVWDARLLVMRLPTRGLWP